MYQLGKRRNDEEASLSSNLSDLMSAEEFEQLRLEAKKVAQPSLSRIASVEVSASFIPASNHQRFERNTLLDSSKTLYNKFSSSRLQDSGGSLSAEYLAGTGIEEQYAEWTEKSPIQPVVQVAPASKGKPLSSTKQLNYYEEFLKWRSTTVPVKQSFEETLSGSKSAGYYDDVSNPQSSRDNPASTLEAASRFMKKPTVDHYERRADELIDSELRKFEQEMVKKVKKEEKEVRKQLTQTNSQPPDVPIQQPIDPMVEYRSKLKQKLLELERVNRELQELRQIVSQEQPKSDRKPISEPVTNSQSTPTQLQLIKKNSDRPLDKDLSKQHFQHIIQRPPFREPPPPSQAIPIARPPPQLANSPPTAQYPPQRLPPVQVCVQTESKADSCTQTGTIRRELDMTKIASLSDQDFIDFYFTNKQYLQKIATPEQLTALRNRHDHLVNGQSIRELLRSVLEQTPKQTLSQLPATAKRKAYDLLYS